MEISGVQSTGRVFSDGVPTVTDPLREECENPRPVPSYPIRIPGRASVAEGHESLKTPGSKAYAGVMATIEAVAGDPSLTDREKRAKINEWRKRLGLSQGDMKKYYTKPLERSYAHRIERLKSSGIDTPEKQAVLKNLEDRKKLYKSLYKPGGCVKKAFKGIGKGFQAVGKAALGTLAAVFQPVNLIPLVGPLLGSGRILRVVSSAFSKISGFAEKTIGRVWDWTEKRIDDGKRAVGTLEEMTGLPKKWLDEAKGFFLKQERKEP